MASTVSGKGIDHYKWHRLLSGKASTVKNGIACLRKGKLRRRDRTFHGGDRVAAVVWVILDNRMSVFIWSSQSGDRYDRDDYMATWLYTKK